MTEDTTSRAPSPLMRTAIWVAIGALIAAAFVCVVWVLFGPENGLVARAFLTVLLLAAFAGVAILDVHLSPTRPVWFVLTSMGVWVLILLIGAFMIWMPEPGFRVFGVGFERLLRFLLIVLILQLALLHVRLFSKALDRYRTTFTTVVTYVTIALVAILAVMLVIPLVLEEYFEYEVIYWRLVVALAILAAVGTALVPLVNLLFAPRRPRPVAPAHAAAYAQPATSWPTYVDGVTPLPVMPDGSPDWNAYYTGYPTYPQPDSSQARRSAPEGWTPQPAVTPYRATADQFVTEGVADGIDETTGERTAPSARSAEAPPAPPTGYEGFPPPPPLPPRA